MSRHTPGPWKWNQNYRGLYGPNGEHVLAYADYENMWVPDYLDFGAANAALIQAAPDMLEALRLHKAWSDSERAGPDYGGQSRNTHPDGEAIWSRWWNNQLDLCDRATEATDAAIAKAEGRL